MQAGGAVTARAQGRAHTSAHGVPSSCKNGPLPENGSVPCYLSTRADLGPPLLTTLLPGWYQFSILCDCRARVHERVYLHCISCFRADRSIPRPSLAEINFPPGKLERRSSHARAHSVSVSRRAPPAPWYAHSRHHHPHICYGQ